MLARERTAVLVSPWTAVILALFITVVAPEVLAAVLLAALCHELGHYAALRRFGGKVDAVRITAFGAEMQLSERCRLSYGQEWLAIAAGPAVNILLALLLSTCGRWWEGAYLLSGSHLVLGAFNLLPVRPLDGCSLLWLAAAWLTDPFLADRIARATGTAVCFLLALLGAWLWYRNGSPFLLLSVLGLWAAKRKEKGLVKERKTR